MALLNINSIRKGHLLPIIKILYLVIAVFFVSIYFLNDSFYKETQMLDKRITILNQQSTIVENITLENFYENPNAATFVTKAIEVLKEGNDVRLTLLDVENLSPENHEVSEQILRNIGIKWNTFQEEYKGYYMNPDKSYTNDLKLKRSLHEIMHLQGVYYSVLKKRKNILLIQQNTFNSILSLLLVLAFLGLFYLQQTYQKNLLEINNILQLISKGNTQKVKKIPTCEFKETYTFIEKILKNQRNVSHILKKIGDGDFSIDFKKSSKKDLLGQSVITMRDKLHEFFEEDKRKTRISSWTNQGLALFGEIMRNSTESIEMLAEKINYELVKYLEANQGAFYILETKEEENNKEILTLISAYAWDRKKHLERTIEAGEGIIGQVLLEKETTYLTDVPNNFVHITSGLGEANPRAVLIVPIKVNSDVYGVLEIASFKLFEDYQIQLVEKVAESIASVIGNIRTNEETKILLKDSQLLTEQMRSQEEELRQNTEELQATQENINHKLEIIDFQRQKNEAILEASADGLITFDQNGNIELFNQAAEDIWQSSRDEVIGNSIIKLMPLEIDLDIEGSAVYFVQEDGKKIPLAVRTEVSVLDSFGDDVPVLVTISKSKIGDEMYFALFVQSIAVELF